MRALFVSSEIYPLAKTGGLADVSHSLPAALRALGVDVRLLMPAYPQALEHAESRQPPVPIGPVLGFNDVALVPARVPGCELPVWLVDCPDLFAREGRIYGDGDGRDWPDNHLRFAMLSRVAAGLGAGLGPIEWRPQVLHANDWHTGLLPLMARTVSTSSPPTLFTIHNMAFQGVFGAGEAARLGLSQEHLGSDGVEYYGNISFLKAGILYADKLTTVSPSYAREIMSPQFGLGLEGVLATRAADLTGILNGADYGVWDPSRDGLIPARYSVAEPSGKRDCKAALQTELGLDVEADTPLFGYMSRLTEQKMADQVLAVAPALAERFGQLVIVAEGERRFESGFAELARRYPGRIAVVIGYREPAAHRLLAGCDALLAPARFEPCGLTQLYAMRYGALPITHRTGGLADTVVDADTEAVTERRATGFHAAGTDVADLLAAIERTVELYRQPLAWRRVREAAMAQDFSWSRSASRYFELYLEMTGTDEVGALASEPLVELAQLRA